MGILLLSLGLFLFRHSIRVWIHSKYGVRVFESLECKVETGKLFDAYLSYSPGDDVFVRQVLSHDLEVGSKYRVCLHHRDLPANTVISDTVVRAAEAAQRTIVVLSPNFLKTEWARYDYKSGLLQAVNQGSKKVIFVLVGSVENTTLDPNLRLLLKNNIVLQWGDSLFWEKMRYSLPDLQQAQPQVPSSYSSYRARPQEKQLQGSVNHALHMWHMSRSCNTCQTCDTCHNVTLVMCPWHLSYTVTPVRLWHLSNCDLKPGVKGAAFICDNSLYCSRLCVSVYETHTAMSIVTMVQ